MFEITGVNVSGSLKAVVMATGYENPLSSVNEIETKLTDLLGQNENGKILFDLLCANGLEWNRFVTLEMKYGRIMLDSAKIIDVQEIPAQILSKLTFTLLNHPEYLEASVLTPDDVRQVLSMDMQGA
ncbi:TPA: type II toxin-antitoxin system RnlB family antitoxin [Klebsiella pneumoniae]|uniref:type II toxin-antitoxin system RnlB family antitoxin n=1 Tax=Enterobacterales TaxID=91347 RepID=UPI0006693DBA|nr:MULTISPECIES: type II toxin-antitoxin system RnlB family antitoxin [Enterobacteriaceae]GJK93639.1 antitoxin RnlB [Klebsiella oxytoca]HDT0668506.1 type II toxin-antitoxin system RnlB family antitoxin [Klebsiella aerogenes]HDW0120358.1 type II toxin-antitoxin system RnlB family antitoxin [Enterobacter asburiae]MCI7951860.1 type II toxin-antitoxin system RnlB family antitoxin [Klebsiella pneumoniae]MCW4839409.1 type II toxin-antitoxin system RnlB family antitoxin [Enterobacter hormaechei subsp